jgi:hypothetical protein
MSDDVYTRGGWIVIHNPTNISIATAPYENGGRQVAFVQCVSSRRKRIARRNAQVMSAAPELLEALKGWAGYWRGVEDTLNSSEREMYEATLSAIEKAEDVSDV